MLHDQSRCPRDVANAAAATSAPPIHSKYNPSVPATYLVPASKSSGPGMPHTAMTVESRRRFSCLARLMR